MFGRIAILGLALGLAACSTVSAEPAPKSGLVTMQQWAAGCKPWDDWDKPAPPFKIYGDTYYVGTCGIAAILIAGDDGHILIDTGTEAGAEVVAANIEKLGEKLEDVAVILHSHEHHDHVGGFAWMREQTGAEIYATTEASAVLESGKLSDADPQAGMHGDMKKVVVAGQLLDKQSLPEAAKDLNFIRTPGHSPGALSWQWEECVGGGCRWIVFADSLSPISRDGYKFSDYPDYVAAYRAGLDGIEKLGCDILLTPHPSHSQMVKRAAIGNLEGYESCAEYAAKKHSDLDKRLAKEAETTSE